jgi:hypothetical protein
VVAAMPARHETRGGLFACTIDMPSPSASGRVAAQARMMHGIAAA